LKGGAQVLHQILGFSAHKQGGKTTAVNGILDAMPLCTVLPFAAELKDVVRRCFVPASWPSAQNIDWSERDKQALLPCGKTLREVLQVVGTDWFRGLWPDVWVNAWRAKMAESKAQVILVPDVRFPNELAAIQEMGGHVIRLTRTPFPEDQHASEIALDGNEHATLNNLHWGLPLFAAVLDNRAMSIAQQNAAVLDLVHQKGWIDGLKENKCSTCDGTGKVHSHNPVCWTCNGTGRKES
jgi:hypothetical protein